LVVKISFPVAAPAAVGLNCTASIAVCLGLSVKGKDAPDTVNPGPDIAAALTVTAAVPVEDSVRLWIDGDLTATFPNAICEALVVSAGTDAPSWIENVAATVPSLALRTAA